ncbi:hypothetical protein LCGC14_1377940 [marine sediment metagenome]|uniref:Uncharacterized protein n=1 Tax=marine sediment metagenome TaxID=412755 RepID=A0A0F9KPE8_9ZZZZ
MSEQATPAMREQMAGLEVADIPKDGKETLTQNQADPSPAASPEGAPVEPTGSQTEAQPSPQPASPAAPEAAPVEPATAQPAAVEAKPEDEAAALAKLNDWVTERTEKTAEEARRTAQSLADKQESQFSKLMEASDAQQLQLRQEMRELQARDLTDEERAKLQVVWSQDDREAQLTQAATKLDEGYRDVTIMSLLTEYKDTGIKRSDLEAIENLEEMELYCEQQTNVSLREKLDEMKKTAEAAPGEPVAPATPAESAEQPKPNVPGVPAGATAQSDVGTGGPSAEGKKFSEEKNPEAFFENLQNMQWAGPPAKQ